MNQFVYNIMLIYFIASCIYFVYLIYLRLTNAKKLTYYLSHDEELLSKYNKIKKNHIMVFIIGILIGLMYIVMNQSDSTIESFKNISNKYSVSDVDDIKVL